ncbi:MAG TPA: serine/threonine-protein kinase [Candidatus Thermoplasmatota archaeon]|nr:serine/threonine-protein kinase [Candidatus Thermoplasmatota archaeon]
MSLLLDPPNWPDIAIGLLVLALGAAVLLARPRQSENAYFAAFMGFIGWGILAGVASLASATAYRIHARDPGHDPVVAEALWRDAVLAHKLFLIPYVFDPLALLYFSSIYPRRNRLNRSLVLPVMGAVGLALLVWGLFLHDPAPPSEVPSGAIEFGLVTSDLGRAALLAYMLAAYALALGALTRDVSRAEAGTVRARGRLLLVALGTAVFARLGLALGELPVYDLPVFDGLGMFERILLVRLAGLGVALGAAIAFHEWFLRRAPPSSQETLAWTGRWTVRLVLALGFLVWFPPPLLFTTGILDARFQPSSIWAVGFTLDRALYSSRWLVFGGLVGYSILRYQLFDLSLRARRLAVDGAVGLALLGVLVLALSIPPPETLMSPPVLVGVAVVSAVGFHQAFRRIRVAFLRDDAAPDLHFRKMEVYRAAVEAWAERGDDARGDLDALRRRLRLDDTDARAVERLVTAPPSGGALLPGAVVAGRYEVERLLGRGGGGRVFLATDPLLRRRVVLKEVFGTGREGETARALSEARLVGSLLDPHIVVVFDTVRWGNDYLIVMEYMDQGSADHLLEERGPLPPDEAVRIARDALAGLATVHRRGIAHGDVKPSNVLLGAEGRAKLADFGIARAGLGNAASRTLGGADAPRPLGLTTRYAAPEVVAGAAPTARSDVYSAGLLLLDLLLGRSVDPVEARVAKAAEVLGPAVARPLRAALSADPRDRPADAAEMRAMLDEALDG